MSNVEAIGSDWEPESGWGIDGPATGAAVAEVESPPLSPDDILRQASETIADMNAAAARDYVAMVFGLVEGQPALPMEELLRITAAAGKSQQDLRMAVTKLASRKDAQAKWRAGLAARERSTQLSREHRGSNAELNIRIAEIRAEAERQIAELQAPARLADEEIRRLDELASEAVSAAGLLNRTADPAILNQQYKATEAPRHTCMMRIADLETIISRGQPDFVRKDIAELQATIERQQAAGYFQSVSGRTEKLRLEREIESSREYLAAYDAAVAELPGQRQRLAEIEEQRKRILESVLDWRNCII